MAVTVNNRKNDLPNKADQKRRLSALTLDSVRAALDTAETVSTVDELRALFVRDELASQAGERPVLVDVFCRVQPVKAFELATDVLGQIAERANGMAVESGCALAQIEARRVRIDREQAENRRLLDALVAGPGT